MSLQNAIWLRSLQTGAWQAVDRAHSGANGHISGTSMDIDVEEPKPRFAHQFVYDPVRDEHYVGLPACKCLRILMPLVLSSSAATQRIQRYQLA